MLKGCQQGDLPSTANETEMPSPTPPWRRHLARVLVAWSLLSPSGLVWSGPVADITAAANQRPTIVATPSGIPFINIAAPNAAGQSYNRYSRFDSDPQGLIFNNSRSAGANLFGEQLAANPNLAGNSARTIINEVVSAMPSSLNGAMAIFGDSARLVLINPNGITCNGCGFINTSGVTLSTGTSRWLDASGSSSAFETATALAFEVRGGRIEISGQGLASPLDRLDLIAQTLKINAPVDIGHGALNLIAGRQSVDHDTLVRLGSLAGNDKATIGEDYAIDASVLGAMNAGSIRFIATAAGMGVRSERNLAASSGDLEINANGDLNLKRVDAARDLHLASSGRITHASILAGRDLSITAAQLDNRGQIIAAVGDATLSLSDSLPDTFANTGGQILAGKTLSLALDNADIDLAAPEAGQFSGVTGLDLRARKLRNSGTFSHSAALTLTATDTFTNTGTILAGSDLDLSAGTLINRGLIAALNDARFRLGRAGVDVSSNAAGTLYAGRDLTLTTPSAGAFGGTVAAERDLALNLSDYTHSPGETDFLTGRDFRIQAHSLKNRDTLQAARDLSLDLVSLDNRGVLLAGQDILVHADTVNNQGGVIEARRDLAITANSLTNGGVAQSTTYVASSLPGYVANVLAYIRDPVIQQKLFNEIGPDWVNKNSRTTLLNRNQMYLDGGISIQHIDLILTEFGSPATLSAGRNLSASVSGALSNNASLISAGGDIALDANHFANSAGQNSYFGRVYAGGGFHFLGAYGNASASVQAGGALTVIAPTQSNSGNLLGNSVWLGGNALANGLTDYHQPTPASALPASVTSLPVPSAGQRFTPTAASLFSSTTRLSLLVPGSLNAQLPEALRNSNHPYLLDAKLEQQALREAALKETGRQSFLGMNDPEQERAQLYDNAVRFASANNARLGVALSPEQIAQLNEPILWYETQEVSGADGEPYQVLVPRVYLPDTSRTKLANLAGGLIQGQDVVLDVRDEIRNTGYIDAGTLDIDTASLVNEKRSAEWGRLTQNIQDGYLEVWGDRVQPGGFISAVSLDLNAERIASISGEFLENGEDASARLQAAFGSRFSQRQAIDHTETAARVSAGMGVEQVVILIVAIIVAIYTAGAATGMIAAAAESGAAAAGLTAAEVTAAGVVAAGSTSTLMIAGAAGSMAASATTQLLTTGRLDAGELFKAGATGALTAGILNVAITEGGQSINQLAGIKDIAGTGSRLANFSLDTLRQNLGQNLGGMALRAVVNAGVSTTINGGSFGNAFRQSLVSDLAAVGANAIGQGTDVHSVQNVAAHAALGAAAAALTGKDAVAGAIGGAGAAIINPLLDSYTTTLQGNDLVAAHLTGSMLVTGVAAQALGRDGVTAANAAQNETLNNWLMPKESVLKWRAEKACAAGNANGCQLEKILQALDAKRENTPAAKFSQGFVSALVLAGGQVMLIPVEITLAIAEGRSLEAIQNVLKGVVNLPGRLVDGLNSSDPAVRGAAVAESIMLVPPVMRVVRALARGLAGGISTQVASSWKPAAQLSVNEANRLLDSALPVGARIDGVGSANAVNAAAVARGYEAPLAAGTKVTEFTTTQPSSFVRVFSEGSKSEQVGSWVMRSEDIVGLNAEQIASKYSLPQLPTMMTDVSIPAGTKMQASVANNILQGANGGGGGVQFKVQMPSSRPPSDWFTNSRALSSSSK